MAQAFAFFAQWNEREEKFFRLVVEKTRFVFYNNNCWKIMKGESYGTREKDDQENWPADRSGKDCAK